MSVLYPKPTKKEKVPKVLRAKGKAREGSAVKGDVVTWRNPELLEYVRTLPCVGLRCAQLGCPGVGPNDPHHVMTGTGHRRGVDLVVPLSRVCHDYYTAHPNEEPRWWQWYGLYLLEQLIERPLLPIALRALVTHLQD